MSLNLAVMLVENARRIPGHPVILSAGRTITFAELDADVNRFANVLSELGLRRGQKVLLMLPNVPEFVVAYYGILKAGGVVVPTNVMYKARELEFLLADSESVACITNDDCFAEVREAFDSVRSCRDLIVVSSELSSGKGIHRYDELMRSAKANFEMVPTDADETAIIVYTSGTTGKPKGAELTHFGQFFQCRVLPGLTRDMIREDDVATLSRLRTDGNHGPRGRRRHDDLADAALRGRGRSRANAARQSDRLRGCTDHVRANAPSP